MLARDDGNYAVLRAPSVPRMNKTTATPTRKTTTTRMTKMMPMTATKLKRVRWSYGCSSSMTTTRPTRTRCSARDTRWSRELAYARSASYERNEMRRSNSCCSRLRTRGPLRIRSFANEPPHASRSTTTTCCASRTSPTKRSSSSIRSTTPRSPPSEPACAWHSPNRCCHPARRSSCSATCSISRCHSRRKARSRASRRTRATAATALHVYRHTAHHRCSVSLLLPARPVQPAPLAPRARSIVACSTASSTPIHFSPCTLPPPPRTRRPLHPPRSPAPRSRTRRPSLGSRLPFSPTTSRPTPPTRRHAP